MLIRKTRSFVKKIIAQYISISSYLKIKILEDNIFISKNVSIGKNVKIRTTDNGKVIIKKNVSIEDNVEIIAQNSQIIIEENTFIGKGTQIVSKESISIGEDCLIAAYCVIRDNNHNIKKNQLINFQGHSIKSIFIENDVWLGTHCVVTAGCRIGEGSVVGANAVITKDVDKYTVVGGVPAKFIKKRL